MSSSPDPSAGSGSADPAADTADTADSSDTTDEVPVAGSTASGSTASGSTVALTERGRPAASAPTVADTVPAGDDAADRGRLDIAQSVVRRIAEHAADLTEGTVRAQRRLAGVGLGESGAHARVATAGDQVDVRLDVPLAYPAPIALTVEAVRGNVRERVQTLTGYVVRSLDVTVSALTAPPERAPTSRTV
jgi:uncharacterized alkaline shock family protein YloU